MVVRFLHFTSISQGSPEKQSQQTNHIYMIYSKESVHVVLGAGKTEVSRAGQQAQNSKLRQELML